MDKRWTLDFADYMRTLRRSRRLTQAQIATTLDVNHGYYGHWERGSRLPSMDMIERIADRLAVPHADVARAVAAARGYEPPPAVPATRDAWVGEMAGLWVALDDEEREELRRLAVLLARRHRPAHEPRAVLAEE